MQKCFIFDKEIFWILATALSYLSIYTHSHSHFPECHIVYGLFICLLSWCLVQTGSLWLYQQTPLSVSYCIHSHAHIALHTQTHIHGGP